MSAQRTAVSKLGRPIAAATVDRVTVHRPGDLLTTSLSVADLASLDGRLVPPVLVAGMHNSGTSILAEILEAAGLFMGANMAHHESHFFSIFINDLLLLGGPSSWVKTPIMPTETVLGFYDDVADFVRDNWIVDYLQWGYDGKSRWGFKDPRLCILMPLYLRIFPDATVVHIERDVNDVAASLTQRSKRGVADSSDFNQWKQLSMEYNERVVSSCNSRPGYLKVSYDDLCLDTVATVSRLLDGLDLDWTPEVGEVADRVHSSSVGSYQTVFGSRRRRLLGRRLKSVASQTRSRLRL